MLIDLLSNLFAFAADEGSGTDAPDAKADDAPDPAPDPVRDGDDTTTADDDTPDDDKSTDVIPVDKLNKRLERARNEAVSKLLKSLGVDDAETLKTLVESEKKRREGEMTELQKAQRDAEKVAKERDEYKQKYDALLETVRRERLAAGLAAAAPTAKHPEDILLWARQYAADDLAAVQDEDGNVDAAKAKALVNKCLKARPEYFHADTPGVPSNNGALTPGTHEQVKRAAETAVRQAKSFM